MTYLKKELKEKINSLSGNIANKEYYIDFCSRSDQLESLTNMVFLYQKLYFNELPKENSSIDILLLYTALFPSFDDTNPKFVISFISILLKSFSHFNKLRNDKKKREIANSKILDFKFTNYLELLITFSKFCLSVNDSEVKNLNCLFSFSSECFTYFFESNPKQFSQSIPIFLSSRGKFATFVNQIHFPNMSSIEIFNEIISQLIVSNSNSIVNPIVISKLVKSIIMTNKEIIPEKLTGEGDFYEILSFLLKIIHSESHKPYQDLLKFMTGYSKFKQAFIEVSVYYFSVSNDNSLVHDFISFIQCFKKEQFEADFPKEMFNNINPTKVEQIYDILRQLCRFGIANQNKSCILNIVEFVNKMTNSVFELVSPNNQDSIAQMASFLSGGCDLKMYPYQKAERFAFYLIANDTIRVRQVALDLLFKISQVFEKENTDWKDYELCSQALYRQFSNEIEYYIKKNKDTQMDLKSFVVKSRTLPALCYFTKRTATNRGDFAAKVLKEGIETGKKIPHMICFAISAYVPILLRMNKKIKYQPKQIFNLAQTLYTNLPTNNKYDSDEKSLYFIRNESLSLIDHNYLIEFLGYLSDSDTEAFVQLTQAALRNLPSIKANQSQVIQEEINVLQKFTEVNKLSSVAQAVINIVSQFELNKEEINIEQLIPILEGLFSENSTSNQLSCVSDAFIKLSKFLIEKKVDYNILFIEQCDMNFLEIAITNYHGMKEKIIDNALHFIPEVVTMYYLNEKQPLYDKVATSFLFCSSTDLNKAFLSKFPQVSESSKNLSKETVFNLMIDKTRFFQNCIKFFDSPYLYTVAARVLSCIQLFGSNFSLDTKNDGKEVKKKLFNIFIKLPTISPWEILLSNAEDSYMVFKTLIELGAPDSLVEDLYKNCKYSKDISNRFYSTNWDHLSEANNENSLRLFRKIISYSKLNIQEKLSMCKNYESFKVVIQKAIKTEDLFIIILTANTHLKFKKIAYLFISEYVQLLKEIKNNENDEKTMNEKNLEKFIEKNLGDIYSFMDICVILIQLGSNKITNAIFDFVSLVCEKITDGVFVSDVINMVVYDDKFSSLILKDKLHLKNVADDEALFWVDVIKGDFSLLPSDDLVNVISWVCKVLEYNTIYLKHRCLEIVSRMILSPCATPTNPQIINFVEYLIYSKNSDSEFAYEFLRLLNKAIGHIEINVNNIEITTYRRYPDEVREYFCSLLE
ncbi:hypothetical protein TRFO_04022 [Tritrichomonas foetus]|uniref:Uncharacterized protein n=1 Tax=Tritrichomonas foetus TaxID=1144522 RepID=A0A1J4KNU0_9EUKA|nr:hypothetical protein TRFO_04022 [Tritrichomonas foetus]|eukprot:OHT11085.1 hypothetical protein TRFO_04022 [Tritrichomonas foetus]